MNNVRMRHVSTNVEQEKLYLFVFIGYFTSAKPLLKHVNKKTKPFESNITTNGCKTCGMVNKM